MDGRRSSRTGSGLLAVMLIVVAVAGLVAHGPAAGQEPTGSTPPGRDAQTTAGAASPAPGAASPAPDTSPAPTGPTESAQQLIARALADGRIDYPTSLAYRGYAFWGDRRLPDDLWGLGSEGEDQSLTEEIQGLGDDVPADLQEVLQSLVVRPADPRSIANHLLDERGAVAAIPGSDVIAAGGSTAQRYLLCPAGLGWRSERVPNVGMNLKFWAVCDGREEGDLAVAIGFARSIWWPMTQYMGAPLPDDGTGGDDAIDIYLVAPGEQARNSVIPGDALAAAWTTDPRQGRRSSGYILTRRGDVGTTEWKQIFIHEFFHILQYRHNAVLTQKLVGNVSNGWWFTEASATWAETYFGRPRSWLTHSWRFEPFQHAASDTSLHVSFPKVHKYNAYVWPMFMQQEKGADVIRRAWDRLEIVGPGDHEEADKVLNGIVPFKTRFRDFAVRMLDKRLHGDPIAPRLQELDPATPIEVTPFIEERSGLKPVKIKELGYALPERLPSLTATYIRLDPHDDTRQVTLDFRKLQSAGDLDIDLVYQLLGEQDWQRKRVDPGERFRFCLDRSDQDVSGLYLILSNHQMDKGSAISGSFRVRPVAEPCGLYTITGSWKLTTGQGGVLTNTNFSASYNFSWDPGYDPDKPGHGSFSSSIATGKPPLPCVPGQFDEFRGRIEPAATALGRRVTFVLQPVHRRGTPPFTDVFSTLFVAPMFGSRWITVDMAGGERRWRDGLIPLDVICQGLRPRGLGSATIVRVRDT